MIPNALFLARLILFGVFGLAVAAKLADRPSAERAIADFGLPAALARPLGRVLPLAELLVALALLPVQTAWLGALGATLLLLVFLVAMAASLLRGRHPDCRCFGQLASAPIGSATVLRNVALVILALAVVIVGPTGVGPSAIDWLGALSPGQLLGVIAAAALLGLLFAAVRELQAVRRQLVHLEAMLAAAREGSATARSDRHASDERHPANSARIAARPITRESGARAAEPNSSPRPPDPLPVGAVAPSFRLNDLQGQPWALDDLLGSCQFLLLVFVDPRCRPCAALYPDLGRWQRQEGPLGVVAISRGTPDQNRRAVEEHGLSLVLLQEDDEIARSYGALGTPRAVLVGPDQRVASVVATGAEAIRDLVARVNAGLGADEAEPSPAENPNQEEAVPPVDPSAHPQPHPDLTTSELDGETILYDPRSGQVHQLNASATLIWALCDGTRPIAAISDAVAATYQLPPAEAEADVSTLIADLHAADLLVVR